jgi:low temperature requirement protein LtrA
VRLLHEVAYLGAARHDPELRRVLLRMLRGLVPSIALLVVATFLHGPWQLVVWAVALFVDYLNVYLSGPAGWRLNSPAHFSERFGLIVIIALGESIVAIGIGIGELPMTWLVAGSAICGIALAAGMWWTYFDVVAHAAEHRLTRATGLERTKIATDSYTFLHLPLIAGVVLVALGLKKSFLTWPTPSIMDLRWRCTACRSGRSPAASRCTSWRSAPCAAAISGAGTVSAWCWPRCCSR